MEVAVWNNLCFSLFRSLDDYSLVHIEGYQVKPAEGKPLGVQISLNSSNTKSVVREFGSGNTALGDDDLY